MKTKVLRSLAIIVVVVIGAFYSSGSFDPPAENDATNPVAVTPSDAGNALRALAIKGRAPKTGYARSQFGDGWQTLNGCDTRNKILARDMTAITYVPTTDVAVCKVASGTLQDPYSGKIIQFIRGADTSDDVQIDHVVALSDAWQKGAQSLTPTERETLANDPLELLAVDGPTNQAKSDGDAATWLPPNKLFRCNYVARQIAVKQKYRLWVTRGEYDAMATILNTCPTQTLPTS